MFENDSCLIWGLVAILLVGGAGYALYAHTDLALPLSYIIGINAITYLLYRLDKLLAKEEDDLERIPNALLAALPILGGSLGALAGIYLKFLPRETHKTSSKYLWLRAIVWASLLGQLALAYCYSDQSGRCPTTVKSLLDGAGSLLSGQ
jgi:uncharacterized membrane protein YsdA (DUF1294 family)